MKMRARRKMRKVVAYLEKAVKSGRGKRIAKVVVVTRGNKIVRGEIVTDVDKDKKPDRVTFWRRKHGRGYAANVSLSSQRKRKAKKKK